MPTDLTLGTLLTGSGGGGGGAPRGSAYRALVLADNPQLYWRVGETSGTTAADASGNNRPGTYQGGYTLAQAGALVGDADGAVRLGGVNGSVQRANPAGLILTAGLTVEAWCWLDQYRAGDNSGVVMKVNEVLLRTDNGLANRMHARVFLSGSYGTAAAAPNPFPLGQWVHVAMTWDGALLKLYQQGVEVASVARTGTEASQTSPLLVGTEGSSGWWQGVVDEFAVYGTALAPARIAARVTQAATP